MSDRPIQCNIKNPVLLTLTDSKAEFHSGCRAIDITFPNVTNPEVGEITFKNSYVAYITIRVKQKPPVDNGGADTTGGAGELKWKTCVRRHRLMPAPHCETGAQDYFSISKKHFMFDMNNITAIRIILQQPSPVWKDFRLEELKLYRSTETNRPPALPAWLVEETMNNTGKKSIEREASDFYSVERDASFIRFPTLRRPIPGIASLDAIASSLQQLWALSEEVAANQTNLALGRFDVDGCYEINLLSYT